MFPLNPMRPLVILLGRVSARSKVHFFLFIIPASTVDVDPMLWIHVNDSFEKLLGFVEGFIGSVSGLIPIRSNGQAWCGDYYGHDEYEKKR
jgi:hypothetical protein